MITDPIRKVSAWTIKNRTLLFLVVVILMGTALRIHNLDYLDITRLEARNLEMSRYSLSELFTQSIAEKHGPTFYLIYHLWTRLADHDIKLLRLPAALFGIATIASLFALGRELFSERAGAIAALLIALSPLHIAHSQEARMFTLFGFLAVSSFYTLRLGLKKRSFRSSILYALTTTLMLYALPYGYAIFLSQLCYVIYYVSKQPVWPLDKVLRRPLFAIAAVVFLALPEIVLFTGPLGNLSNLWFLKRTTINSYLNGLQGLVYGYLTPPLALKIALLGLYIILCLGGIMRCICALKSKDRSESAVFLLTWMFVPILAVFTFSIFFFPIFDGSSRYLLGIYPAVLLLVGYGMEVCGRWWQAGAVALVIISVLPLVSYHADMAKSIVPVKDASMVIHSHTHTSNEPVYGFTPVDTAPFRFYLQEHNVRTLYIWEQDIPLQVSRKLKEQEVMFNINTPFWIVFSFQDLQHNQTVREWLLPQFEIFEENAIYRPDSRNLQFLIWHVRQLNSSGLEESGR